MARTYTLDVLSASSIKNLQKQLETYQRNLQTKCELLVTKLATAGETVALQRIDDSPLGTRITLTSTRAPSQMGCSAILLAVGEVKEVEDREPFNLLMAVEFGAGIHCNATPNPKASLFGMGVGTYPGQVHAFEDGWYFWDDEKQSWVYSHGVKATMPMYSASLEILARYKQIAMEVFGG